MAAHAQYCIPRSALRAQDHDQPIDRDGAEHGSRERRGLLIALKLPRITEHVSFATITAVHVAEGDLLKPGSKLLDVSIDLSSIAPHDCPPISLYRIATRDRAWLRRLCISTGESVIAGADLAYFTTEPDEPLTGTPSRSARISVAGIIDQTDWLTAGRP